MSHSSSFHRLTGLGVAPGMLLAALSGFGCAPDTSDLRAEGVRQYRNRQYVESMATMRHVLDLDADDAEANYYMGMNYRVLAERRFREGDVVGARKRLDNAIRYFTAAIGTWPNYLAAISAKNEALESRGKYDQALEDARHIAHINRGDAEHFVFLANEYRERGDYDNALRNYKLALASNPESAQAYYGLGRLYQLVGDRALAMDSFQKATELDPRNTAAADALERLSRDADIRHASHDYE